MQAQGRIHSRFSRAVKAKQWSEADARRALSQVKYTSTFPDLAEVDFVSEAVRKTPCK
jgi:3-hydroxyacyl-CoA dehydrogenase